MFRQLLKLDWLQISSQHTRFNTSLYFDGSNISLTSSTHTASLHFLWTFSYLLMYKNIIKISVGQWPSHTILMKTIYTYLFCIWMLLSSYLIFHFLLYSFNNYSTISYKIECYRLCHSHNHLFKTIWDN